MRLDGKTAVITGAASGIGRATAETLAQAGAHVLLGDIAVDTGEQGAAEIRAKGLHADFIRLDVTDLESIEALVHELQRYKGTLLFVSHDRWFVSRLATAIVAIRPVWPPRVTRTMAIEGSTDTPPALASIAPSVRVEASIG